MSDLCKKKELLATINKIERLKSESGFFTKNKWKTIAFATLVSILGPFL